MKTEKIIWFKKPKCAGSSFEDLLQQHGCIYYVDKNTSRDDLTDPAINVICIRSGTDPSGDPVYRTQEGTYKRKKRNLFQALLKAPFEPLEMMKQKFPDILEQHHKFAIIRNPYDKFVSSWQYLKSTKELPIEHVLANLPTRKNFHDWLHITKTQTACLYEQGKLMVDQLVYMESNFQNDINALLDRINLNPQDLPKINVNKRKPYIDYLTEDAISGIQRIYRQDFTNFNYSLDPSILTPQHPNQQRHPSGCQQ